MVHQMHIKVLCGYDKPWATLAQYKMSYGIKLVAIISSTGN